MKGKPGDVYDNRKNSFKRLINRLFGIGRHEPIGLTSPASDNDTSKTSLNEYKTDNKQLYTKMYRIMFLIRNFEEKLVELHSKQEIKCMFHLYTGEEAIATGVSMNLKPEDYVFSNYRSHGHYIAKGGDLKSLMAELYGKVTGCSKGKGGSMHVVDPSVGLMGSSAIVSGCIPIAVGAALAFKLQKKDRVSVVFFGDGAVDEGVFYESLNFASLKKLPVVFICENNFYAIDSHQLTRQPADNIAEKASIYLMPGQRVDGNNVIEVYDAVRSAVKRARLGEGPTLIECRTYRWKAHVGPKDDTKWGSRSKSELEQWINKCPVRFFEQFLLENNILSKKEMLKIQEEIKKVVNETVEFSKKSSYPKVEEVYEGVFYENFNL